MAPVETPILTVRDAARDFLRPLVRSFADVEALIARVDSPGGAWDFWVQTTAYEAHVGGILCPRTPWMVDAMGPRWRCKHAGVTEVAVRLPEDERWTVYPLRTLYAEIEREMAGEPVQGVLL